MKSLTWLMAATQVQKNGNIYKYVQIFILQGCFGGFLHHDHISAGDVSNNRINTVIAIRGFSGSLWNVVSQRIFHFACQINRSEIHSCVGSSHECILFKSFHQNWPCLHRFYRISSLCKANFNWSSHQCGLLVLWNRNLLHIFGICCLYSIDCFILWIGWQDPDALNVSIWILVVRYMGIPLVN